MPSRRALPLPHNELRKRLGLQRAIGRTRTILPHPSRGGSRGYSMEFRKLVVQRWHLIDEREGLGVSRRTVTRWQQRIAPFDMNGNK